MHAGDAHQVGAVLFIEVVQIRNVLEVVGVILAVFNSGVGDDIVAVLGDLQVDALLSQDGHALLQDLSVGRGRSADLQGDGLLIFSGLLGLGIVVGVLGGSLVLAAAGGQRQRQGQGQQSGQNLVLHVSFPPIKI